MMLITIFLLLEEMTLLFVWHFLEGCDVWVSLLFCFVRDRPTKQKISDQKRWWMEPRWFRSTKKKGGGRDSTNTLVLAKSCENEFEKNTLNYDFDWMRTALSIINAALWRIPNVRNRKKLKKPIPVDATSDFD